jgi:dolichyl-phosphate-mannose-protein mannosyltransferase
MIKKYKNLLLILILAFTFFTRTWRLDNPDKYVFDEVYHAVTAKLIAQDDHRAYEWWSPAPEPDTAVDWLHPPLAKYTQAFFINYFGENSFGWRFSSVIFGVMVVGAVYVLSKTLFKDKPYQENVSLLAAFLTSLDGLILTQSRIAMNDIHVTFFILLTLIFYLRHRQNLQSPPLSANKFKTWILKWRYLILSGLSAGLAVGTKWSGIFVLGFIGLWEGVSLIFNTFKNQNKNKLLWKDFITKNLIIFSSLIIVPIIVYILSYSHMFIQGKSLICNQQKSVTNFCYFEKIDFKNWHWEGYISHFQMLHRQIWHYQTNLEATHTYQSRPWQWFLNLKPVWFHVKYLSESNQIANIYAFGNPALFWIGDIAIIITLLALLNGGIYWLIHKFKSQPLKLKNNLYVSLVFLMGAYFITWLPWQLSPRIMFFYHYTPAVPLLSINLAFWLVKLTHNKTLSKIKYSKLNLGQLITGLIILMIIIAFLIWYPHWTALPVSKDFANQVYFYLSSWK